MFMLYRLDISLEPIDCPAKSVQKNPIYLISYADGPSVFHKNQNTLAVSAVNKGIDFIFMYGRHHLPKSFVDKNHVILSHKQGAGFWVWKPWIILNTLKMAPENAIVIYLDSGFLIQDNLQPLLKIMEERQKPMLFVAHDDLGTSVQAVTQKHTLVRMGCQSEKCLTAPHVWGAVSVYRNTAETRQFVEKWLSWCQVPDAVMQVEAIPEIKIPESHKSKASNFIHHHHDEAILSVLCQQNPHNKTIMPLSQLNQMRVLRWHHRHPPSEHTSLLPLLRKNTNYVQKKLYALWTWPLQKLGCSS